MDGCHLCLDGLAGQRGDHRPLFVHFSDEPPEIRGALLGAAFSPQDGWRVSAVAVNVEQSGTEESTAFGFEYFRYVVCRA